jgi:hypothetical protein
MGRPDCGASTHLKHLCGGNVRNICCGRLSPLLPEGEPKIQARATTRTVGLSDARDFRLGKMSPV